MKGFTNTVIKKYTDKRSNRQDIFYFKTISHSEFTKIYRLTYPNGTKKVSKEWLEYLTSFSLAIWYMDDGSITKSNHMMRISTESFTYKELVLLKNFLFKKWGVCPKIIPSSREGKFIFIFNSNNRNKFFSLIEAYIIPAMEYKIYKEYRDVKWRKWTVKEMEYLRQNYFGCRTNWPEILSLLNRSHGAVARKASYLNLTRRKR